jgi:hypothetical protein
VNFQLPPPLSSLSATLTRMLVSVDCKELTEKLSLLDATLTKNTGVHPSSQSVCRTPRRKRTSGVEGA